MKRRSGIAFLSIAVILLVFSTLTAIYIHNLSKDLFKSQSQALKVKTSQYAKIAIVSMKNWVDKKDPQVGADTNLSYKDVAVPISGVFFLNLETPNLATSQGFSPGLESVRIDNEIRIAIYQNIDPEDSEDGSISEVGSIYALIDSTQTNLLVAQQDKSVYIYSELGNVFKEPSQPFTIKTGDYYSESVIYRYKQPE